MTADRIAAGRPGAVGGVREAGRRVAQRARGLWLGADAPGALLGWLLALVLGALLCSLIEREPLRHGRLDIQRRLSAPAEPPQRVLVVDVDDASVRALRPRFGAWPLRREAYALLGGYLFDAGATAVVFNIVFADEREGDEAFVRFVQQAPGPVVLAAGTAPVALDVNLSSAAPGPPAAAAPTGCEAQGWTGLTLPAWPLPPGGSSMVGMVSTPADTDGRLRTLPLLHVGPGELVPALPLATWLAVHRVPLHALRCEDGEMRAREARWPIDPAGHLWPAFVAEAPPELPMAGVLAAALGSAEPAAVAALRERIRGRVVVVGSSAGFGGQVVTPLGPQDASLLQASLYEALETGRLYRPPRPAIDAAWLALTLLPLGASLRRRRHAPSRDLAWSALALALLFGLDTGLLLATGQLSNLAWPAAALAVFPLLSMLRWRGAQMQLQSRLERERAAAEEANRLKSEFLAHMSHEIRTPMNALLGAAELLAGSPLDAQQRRHVELFRAAGGHLMEILNDLLDLSKIEAGQLDLGLRAFSLSQLVAAQVALFEARAVQRGLVLRTSVAEGLPDVVLGDPKRLAQVLRNLISNAIKFTQAGGVTLALRRGADGRLRFEVIDTGMGIPADRLAAIFQPFTQSDSSITRRFGGTGLGLTISKRLVELMGGRLDVRSEEGRGSCFGFELALPPSSLPPVADWDDSGPGVLSLPLPSLRILLADDNRYNVLLVQAFLEDGGHRLEVVGDGLSALRRFERGHYDLLLMDVQMPVMDGYAATRAIRELEAKLQLTPVPIIALTANAQAGEADTALQAGCTDYLAKPFTRVQLLALLTRHAAGSPAVSLPALAPQADEPPTDDPRIQRLSALQGEQVDSARGRLGQRPGLYEQVLDEVMEPLRAHEATVQEALDRGDRAAAARHAHDLKGLARTIGAGALAEAAAALESHLEGAPDPEHLASLRASVSQHLAACLAALAPDR